MKKEPKKNHTVTARIDNAAFLWLENLPMERSDALRECINFTREAGALERRTIELKAAFDLIDEAEPPKDKLDFLLRGTAAKLRDIPTIDLSTTQFKQGLKQHLEQLIEYGLDKEFNLIIEALKKRQEKKGK